ncbi:MAG: hypothetical protein WCK54_21335 [Desulfuromonadales bacterium]
MAKKRMTVSFSDEAIIKVQTLAVAKRISSASATNELILRGSDAFQNEVYYLTEQIEGISARVACMETNLTTITDILSSLAGGINIIKQKIQ